MSNQVRYPPPPSPPSQRTATAPFQSYQAAPAPSQYTPQQPYSYASPPAPYGNGPTSAGYTSATPPPIGDGYATTPAAAAAAPTHHHIMQETDDELTEDERIEYEKGVISWEKAKDWRFWFRREWLWYYVGLVLIVVLVALMAFFHKSIVNWLTPFTRRLQTLTVGWLIPVAILFVLSFPPLFGNEIVMVLVGVVWGLGVGFAIAAVGTILGEVANFIVFKFWCSARAHRLTKKSLNYASLSQAIVEGGWVMAIIVRLSAVPTHFTTLVFAVCGMKFWHFAVALIVGLPKQLLAVYVGVVLADESGNKNNVVSDVVWGATAVISIFALWFIYHRMLRVRKKVLIGMRHDLQKHHVQTSEPPMDAVGEGDGRAWDAPFNQHAVTEPRDDLKMYSR